MSPPIVTLPHKSEERNSDEPSPGLSEIGTTTSPPVDASSEVQEVPLSSDTPGESFRDENVASDSSLDSQVIGPSTALVEEESLLPMVHETQSLLSDVDETVCVASHVDECSCIIVHSSHHDDISQVGYVSQYVMNMMFDYVGDRHPAENVPLQDWLDILHLSRQLISQGHSQSQFVSQEFILVANPSSMGPEICGICSHFDARKKKSMSPYAPYLQLQSGVYILFLQFPNGLMVPIRVGEAVDLWVRIQTYLRNGYSETHRDSAFIRFHIMVSKCTLYAIVCHADPVFIRKIEKYILKRWNFIANSVDNNGYDFFGKQKRRTNA